MRPHGGGGASGSFGSSSEKSSESIARAQGARAGGRPAPRAASAPSPKTATITFSEDISRLMSSASRITSAIRWPLRPVPRTSTDSRSGSQPATLRAPSRRSSRTSRPGISRTCSRTSASTSMISPSSRSPSTATWRRAASSEPPSRPLGLVDSVRVTARSSRLGSTLPPTPRWRIADWVRLPTILWTEETITSAPLESALAGRRSEKRRCAPQASSQKSGTSRECATSASAATSATAPK